ncbi:PREDICTED: inactive polyglycylase TTLL10 [Miniopterus natalensis]|uniref:inactive polyglycylase TTLL10 n=1 Tax=Miniopterus natalensis TaxID=291302 RepID=UPI0007A6C52E|nr:PREDICTED: inactive polyglycylase TTLL10 [Miniopterus natalensis]
MRVVDPLCHSPKRAVSLPPQQPPQCHRWQRGEADSPYKGGLKGDRQNAETTLPLRDTRPHSRHGDKSQPQAETPRKRRSPCRVGLTSCKIRGLGPRAGLPPGTRVGTKRGKPSRIKGVWRSRPLVPGWAHERPMGSSDLDGLLSQLSQLDQDADPLEDAVAAKPQATLLERHLLGGEKQPSSTGCGPFFYIGGANGASIISSYCKRKGWQRIQDSQREDYKLKWCEVKCRDSYLSFREGEQLLYQLPNNKVLTTKIGLLSTLREYSRVTNKINKTSQCAQAKVLKMEEFFPETYRLDVRDEREAFFALFDGERPRDSPRPGYIQNPLLLDGKKFDVRSYLLIACAMPYMVFFGHGYARLTLSLYDPHSEDLSGHLTNQFMQKKSPLYMLLKEDTVWSMEQLNRYINDKFRKTKGLPRDWVFTTFTKRMQQIMVHCFLAVKSKLECKLGYFDLIGCDFLIDDNFKVWLLEMNSNPALHTNCEVLKEVIPRVVMETLEAMPHSQPHPAHIQDLKDPGRGGQEM